MAEIQSCIVDEMYQHLCESTVRTCGIFIKFGTHIYHKEKTSYFGSQRSSLSVENRRADTLP